MRNYNFFASSKKRENILDFSSYLNFFHLERNETTISSYFQYLKSIDENLLNDFNLIDYLFNSSSLKEEEKDITNKHSEKREKSLEKLNERILVCNKLCEKTNFLNVNISIIKFFLANKKEHLLRCFLLMKLKYSGKFKKTKENIKELSFLLNESERNIYRHFNKLLKLNVLTYSKKSKTYFINKFSIIHKRLNLNDDIRTFIKIDSSTLFNYSTFYTYLSDIMLNISATKIRFFNTYNYKRLSKREKQTKLYIKEFTDKELLNDETQLKLIKKEFNKLSYLCQKNIDYQCNQYPHRTNPQTFVDFFNLSCVQLVSATNTSKHFDISIQKAKRMRKLSSLSMKRYRKVVAKFNDMNEAIYYRLEFDNAVTIVKSKNGQYIILKELGYLTKIDDNFVICRN